MSNLINLGDLQYNRNALDALSTFSIRWDKNGQRAFAANDATYGYEKSGPLLTYRTFYAPGKEYRELLIHPYNPSRVFAYSNTYGIGTIYSVVEPGRMYYVEDTTRTYSNAKWSPSGNYIAASRSGAGLVIRPNYMSHFDEVLISTTELGGTQTVLAWHPTLDYLVYGNETGLATIHFGILKFIPNSNNTNFSYIKLPITNPENNISVRSIGWSPDGNYIFMDNTNWASNPNSLSNISVYKFDSSNDSIIRINDVGFTAETRVTNFDVWTPDGRYIKLYAGIYKWENEKFTLLPNALSSADKNSNGYWFNNGKNYISSTEANANIYWIKDEVYTYFDNLSSLGLNRPYDSHASPTSSNILVQYIRISPYYDYYRIANVIINDLGTVDWSSDTRYIARGFAGFPYIGIYKFDRNSYETTLLTNVGVIFTRTPVVVKWSTDALFLVIGYYTEPYIEIYRWDQPTEKFFKVELDPDVLPTSQPTDIVWSQDGLAFVVITIDNPYAFFYETTADAEIDIFKDLEDMIAISDNPRFRGISIAEGEIPQDLQIIMKTLIK